MQLDDRWKRAPTAGTCPTSTYSSALIPYTLLNSVQRNVPPTLTFRPQLTSRISSDNVVVGIVGTEALSFAMVYFSRVSYN